jgi:hypothetical protein
MSKIVANVRRYKEKLTHSALDKGLKLGHVHIGYAILREWWFTFDD